MDERKAERRGRYRKVEVRTWSDEKFRKLTPMPPCGQGLWLFLITGPHTGVIPGLFRAGRASLAEELNWPIEAFDKAFAEASAQGMVKADFEARLVWLPNAIKINKPESPNVVRFWGSEFELLPECALKVEAYSAIGSIICGLGEGFKKAFIEAFAKPSGKALPMPLFNQEQEQEQEQEPRTACAEPRGGSPPPVQRGPDQTSIQMPKAEFEIPLKNGSTYPIYTGMIANWENEFPHVDVRFELAALVRWNNEEKSRRKTEVGVGRHITSWLGKEERRRRRAPSNGVAKSSGAADEGFSELRSAISSGRMPERWKHPQTRAAIDELGGWGKLKFAESRSLDFMKRDFVEAFNRAAR